MLTGCFMPLDCGFHGPPPVGRFGPYYETNKRMQLANGDTLTVYRVKYWKFTSGDSPALQLEYAAHVVTTDTDAVIAADRVLWPAFAPYVEHLHLDDAIMTGTNLERLQGGFIHTSAWHYFSVVMHRDETGTWYVKGHPDPLPPADASGIPRIFEADGSPFAFMTSPPQVQ
jgi:hypothetical protein